MVIRRTTSISLDYAVEFEFGIMHMEVPLYGHPAYVSHELLQEPEVIKIGATPELQKNLIELPTKVYSDLIGARSGISQEIRMLLQATHRNGWALYGAGRHPFGSAADLIRTTENNRYMQVLDRYPLATSRMNAATVQPNIGGFTSRDQLIQVLDQIRQFFPHMLALFANSPFYEGQILGKTNRILDWYLFREEEEESTTVGIPQHFGNWKNFEYYIADHIKSGRLESIKAYWVFGRPKIFDNGLTWHDPSAKKLGIEFRIIDMGSFEDCMAALALCGALIKYIVFENMHGRILPIVTAETIEENVKSVISHALDAVIYDFHRQKMATMRDSISWLLERIKPFYNEFSAEREYQYSWDILGAMGTGADRQLAAYAEGGFTQVIDYLRKSSFQGLI